MAKKKTRSNLKSMSSPTPTSLAQPTPSATVSPTRDFGMLKVRSMKIKQSQAVVLKEEKDLRRDFAKMTGEQIIKIIQGNNLADQRRLSEYFARTNGIYARAIRYLADIYRFDYIVYPNLDLDIELNESTQKKTLKRFNEILEHFDASPIQSLSRKWAIQICLVGVYYGYIAEDINDRLVIQDLPVDFCRSRFMHRGKKVVEFNVKYFEKITKDEKYREQILNLFPEEIRVGYYKYLQGKLKAEVQGDEAGWIILDLNRAFKFNFYDNDIPPFLFVIPSLLNLAEVQDLEKEKLLQELQKILVQTFELDKNGQIPFTMTELQRLNQNAIDMVGDAVGVSVLSTIADVHLEDLAPENGKDSTDNIQAAEASAYNDMGVSTNLFNTDGNLALEKSILTDAAFVKQLLLQYEVFFNEYIIWKFNKNKSKFRFKMLDTTIFNYIDISNTYKDLTKIGYSRFLPAAALGHSQKEVTSMAKLEQQIMELDNFMLPPFSSNTMSSDTWSDIKQIQRDGTIRREDGDVGGRPSLPNDQKTEKTIQNQESLG